MTLVCVASQMSNSPVIAPSLMTMIRSDIRRSSGISEEIMMMDFPSSTSWFMSLYISLFAPTSIVITSYSIHYTKLYDFDCASLMVFDDTGDTTRMTLDTVDQIDLYLLCGSMDEIVAGIRRLTGKATLLPKWAFGYIQSKERYQTQAEMIEVAERYRALGVPLDCVVQDWKTWAGDLWGQKTVDLARYPDLAAMNLV